VPERRAPVAVQPFVPRLPPPVRWRDAHVLRASDPVPLLEVRDALNARHMQFAWMSLIVVGLTDLYVRLVASGTITDFKLF